MEVGRLGAGEIGEIGEIKESCSALWVAAGEDEKTGDKLAALNDFRILCAHRSGPRGVVNLNRFIISELAKRKLLKRSVEGRYYPVPILIRQNDYQLRLFNGDSGFLTYNSESGHQVHFIIDNKIRTMQLERLPDHEISFAMTVHKSQGSEFDAVVLVLPEHLSHVLTRELIYTAITRSKTQFDVFGDETTFKEALGRTIQRTSGLNANLWKERP